MLFFKSWIDFTIKVTPFIERIVVKTFINRNIPILDKLAAIRDAKCIYTQGQKTRHTI